MQYHIHQSCVIVFADQLEAFFNRQTNTFPEILPSLYIPDEDGLHMWPHVHMMDECDIVAGYSGMFPTLQLF